MTTITVTADFRPGDIVYAVVPVSSTTECAFGSSFLSSITKYAIRIGEVVMVVLRTTNTINEVEYHIRFEDEAGTTLIKQDLDLANDEKSVFGVLDNSLDTSGYQVINFNNTVVGSLLVGLTVGQNISVNVEIDDVIFNITKIATGAETFDDIINDVNTALGAHGIASIVLGNIVITSNTSGLKSKVQIRNDNYFVHLNGFVEIEDSVDGEGGALEAYQAKIS